MLLNRLINVNRIKLRHIKTSQPHIYNNGNLKVRLRIFELTVKFFPILFCAKHIKEVFFIIFITSHNQLDFFHWLQLFFIFLTQNNTAITNLLFCPFRSEFLYYLIEIVCYVSVGTYKHCFACYGCIFCHTGFIMLDKVLRNSTKSVRVANNNFHFGNCFLAFFYLMFICPLKFTLSIVFFNLSYLVLIKHNFSCTTIVNKINCNTILNSFRHCICVYNTAKDFYCSINWSSGKSYISCIW